MAAEAHRLQKLIVWGSGTSKTVEVELDCAVICKWRSEEEGKQAFYYYCYMGARQRGSIHYLALMPLGVSKSIGEGRVNPEGIEACHKFCGEVFGNRKHNLLSMTDGAAAYRCRCEQCKQWFEEHHWVNHSRKPRGEFSRPIDAAVADVAIGETRAAIAGTMTLDKEWGLLKAPLPRNISAKTPAEIERCDLLVRAQQFRRMISTGDRWSAWIVLNVRDANFKQVIGNAEISNLLTIMGLDVKTQYDSTSKLRYGSIMLMTDQDHDGSHIKGLLINLIHFWWPSLAKMNGFLKEFITPIVKVWKESSNNGARREETSFFSMNQYEAWKAQQERKGFKSKYYKGLGTSTAKEAKEYFRDIEQHEIKFKWTGEQDGEAIDLAFNKKRADDRKDWINGYEDGTYVDHTRGSVGYTDFVHKELVQFAKYDVQRSVPSLVDGFKPSQRKVLFCAFKKKLRNDIKVAQFVGYISEQSAYHHGEVSLENTIVNLAQNFVGSNNTNLLVPSGQFGTRLQGGKDHAAARYIYTRLSPVTRILFHPDDDNVLQYLDDEGLVIEPKWYCPILPTVLMNGADGIGVGWSTNIPNYNPREIIRNLRMMLRGMPMAEMHPWYKGFQGSILPNDREPGKYEVTGVIRKRDGTTLEITELPVKNWTQNYKEFLEELMPKDGKKGEESSESTIEDFREYHTESSVHFVVTMTPEKMRAAERAGLEKTFKLKSSLATSNMVLFDAEGKIT
ncbi:unnamed protein product, partial [Polarella glacialis]